MSTVSARSGARRRSRRRDMGTRKLTPILTAAAVILGASSAVFAAEGGPALFTLAAEESDGAVGDEAPGEESDVLVPEDGVGDEPEVGTSDDGAAALETDAEEAESPAEAEDPAEVEEILQPDDGDESDDVDEP